MENKLPPKATPYQKLASRFRHGMILYSIRNILSRIGIEILPYWIEREGMDLCSKQPEIRDSLDEYQFLPIGMEYIQKFFREQNWNSSAFETNAKWDTFAYALYKNSQVAAFMMGRSQSFEYQGKHFELANNEAYLENMYTFDEYRGKNLAPYLRYKCYEVLAERELNVCYSVTQYFNSSSLKFKSKLGAQHRELYLHIGLFNKFQKTFLLKRYPVAPN